ncbi:MAG: type II toxin-antitoxin system RelE/ParE family toxin [Hydrogenophaga sp.]|nr:type II toxin-antitoxin system RelE/ParE family toxin [Hydrogenophaga sp.]
MRLEEYVQEDGTCPFATWFNALDYQAAAKVAVVQARLAQGNTSNIEWFRGIGECKIDWGPGYRIYIAREGDQLIILFGGSTKKGQQKAIDKAVELHAEYKARKRAAETKKVKGKG